MPRLILSSALLSVLSLATAQAFAQVYKWVDEKGVVNYSNEAPADRKVAQLDPKASRLSVIGTDDTQKRPANANETALAEKIDRLERKLDAERYARSMADAQTQYQAQAAADSSYQQCLRDRRVDCDYAGMDPYYYGYGPYYGYWPVVGAKQRPFRDHVRHHRPAATPKSVGRPAFAPVARQM